MDKPEPVRMRFVEYDLGCPNCTRRIYFIYNERDYALWGCGCKGKWHKIVEWATNKTTWEFHPLEAAAV